MTKDSSSNAYTTSETKKGQEIKLCDLVLVCTVQQLATNTKVEKKNNISVAVLCVILDKYNCGIFHVGWPHFFPRLDPPKKGAIYF